MMMAFLVAAAIGLLYVGAFVFFNFFFEGKVVFPKLTFRSVVTVFALFVANLCVVFITFYIPDIELGNRILHTVGGGILAFLACFFAARDSGIRFSRFQFITLAALLVTFLGVGNELVEFFLQSTTGRIFADSITDTWLDLLSNTVGIMCAAILLFSFLKKISRK